MPSKRVSGSMILPFLIRIVSITISAFPYEGHPAGFHQTFFCAFPVPGINFRLQYTRWCLRIQESPLVLSWKRASGKKREKSGKTLPVLPRSPLKGPLKRKPNCSNFLDFSTFQTYNQITVKASPIHYFS